ncbi:SDR family NAD(P)-dependent oxidoreductase [Deinococcus yavapaiensis]|uniref:Short-subunit dehydrogenase n=1 Tax=Deinococcus yavapaiensis KR-236 TaxID=694435 RepID=A0A318S468_9DEIO|nr:SDR family oxidoreductase [Deinococcus yavapaiensis]PYE49942.1 hypothetical protein DES52_12020 [Deinococcus yavapaiensis KR-236]
MTATSGLHALVTGASSGIGVVYADRLAARGFDLTLLARREDRLRDVARDLSARHGVTADVLAADLAESADVRRVEEYLRVHGTDFLVNNAGFAVYRPLADLPEDTVEEMILVNVLALARLTRAALPGMLARGRGTIVNVSSGLSWRPFRTNATYSGTKAFVNNFTRALAEEVEGTNVKVQLLVPGVIRTEFHDTSGTDLDRLPPGMIMEAPDLVDASLKGLDLGELVCVPAQPDPEVIARVFEAQLAASPRSGEVAPRYRS